MDSGEDSQVLTIVRAGQSLRKEDESQFWDDFISLCSNASGLGELLQISPEKIRSWPSRIREALDKLEKHDAESPNIDKDTTMIPTGQNGAVTMNMDPLLGAK